MHTKKVQWKNEALVKACALQKRVEALRGVHYTGCGFHYSLITDAEKTLELISDYDGIDPDTPMIVDIRLDVLDEQVINAENSKSS